MRRNLPAACGTSIEYRVRCVRGLALTSLVARVGLVDDVNAALAANQTIVAVTALERLERVLDLHRSSPCSDVPIRAKLKACRKARREIGLLIAGRCLPVHPVQALPPSAEAFLKPAASMPAPISNEPPVRLTIRCTLGLRIAPRAIEASSA